ncbi:hypothetical protein NM688_g6906 [Phlebia brevispora]|uniref:Uncharacterized protein n=1 Tax=Phlebia brevispora TaxID=194682 RepID=A0ACC1SBC4_9APHY|nr:hypothetical protein NM688_g6906 [Phlebia brevispora]
MPTLRRPVLTSIMETCLIKAITFDEYDSRHSRTLSVPVVIPTAESLLNPRFPCVEALWGPNGTVAETIVEVVQGQKIERFLIVSQYQRDKPVNIALRRLEPTVSWPGRIIVLLSSDKVFVKDLCDADTKCATHEAVRRFLIETKPIITAALEEQTDPMIVLPPRILED